MRKVKGMNLREFYDGKVFDAYEFLGAHADATGVTFRTYAPRAKGVCVIGEFNGWQNTECHRIENGEFWEARVEGAKPGQMYKFRIYQQDGQAMDPADPYAFYSELRPGTASVIYDRKKYAFHDQKWMESRSENWKKPLNIYELHLGSWRRKDDPKEHAKKVDEARENGTGIDVSDGWYTYSEIADLLVPYLIENHYTAVEIMPVNEHPADESWGYQGSGFYSATSRYGDPDGLKKLVELCHKHNISVILDIVTVHFVVNDYALWKFDGTHLYEYPNDAIGMSEWGSCNFDHSRGDICSFLNSASAYWLNDFHFDGLRFDAVGNLIYWQGNQSRGVNTNTVQFMQNMNSGLKSRFPSAMLIAEDSTQYPGVTRPVFAGGLGFDYKWDLGWMHDTLEVFQTDPLFRSGSYHKLTFSMSYFRNEKYLLPLSHDEVVHGKATILQKMSGNYEMKFPQGRTLYLYMFTHPGKKLNFMGGEVGQLREWDEKREQDWFMTEYPLHDAFHRFRVDLNKAYEAHPSLWENDYDDAGFEWLEANAEQQCIYAYLRKAESGEVTMTVLNLSGIPQRYVYHGGKNQKLQLVIDTDDNIYGGHTAYGKKKAAQTDANGEYEMILPAFSGRCYVIE